ncbi:MAG: AMP-binding protein, partial [Lacunisphaera sp.]
GKDDVIVSWLPLYHDMGFIACFVMPLLLKVPVVMIDPMTWVKHPESLLNAIDEYCGTVCYMPNFGFEVMARQQAKASLATMRHWISCSEPTYFPTLEQFCRKLGVAPATVSTCYAMAENVFAVTQSKGVKTVEHAGEKLVSCGSVIPSTRVKLVDDEIWVKSDTSLESYIGTGDVRDADGFYATGDLGMIVDGEVYVSGRKRDVMISGGRKYFLNDLDFAAGKIMRESAGRIAALAEHNQHLGTETVTLLVERPNFWDTSERKSLIDALRETTDLEAIEVHFVPPTFITKTSSGKINRKKTLEDWHTFQTAKSRQTEPTVSGENQAILLAEKIEQSFASLPRDRPLGTELDSLGAVLMRLICDSQGVEYSPEATVDELLQQTGRKPAELPSDRIYSIVALVDGVKLGFGSDGGFITPQFIAEVSRIVGAPVRVEHIAVPPASILFSDLIFHDYFMPRDPGSKYGPFSAVIQKIKRASLVLIDDEDAFRLREYCAYPRLSHRFNQEANADLLGHRLQSYTLNHHLLPREVVTGRDIDPSQITATIEQMANYLKTPVMKLAFHQQFQGFTKGWDYTQYRQYISDVDYQENPVRFPEIQAAIINFIQSHRENVRYTTGAATEKLVLKDLPHFCSFVFNVKAVDYVLGRYRSFCICGLPSSIPYIEKELRKAGKPFFYSTSLNPERTDYDCMLCTGFHGAAPIAKPYYDFVHIGDQGGRPHNVSHEEEIACPTLAEADQELTDVYRRLTGNAVPIGNYVLNEEESIRRRVQSTLPPKRIAPSPRVALS